MSYYYIYPAVVALPHGYNLTSLIPVSAIIKKLVTGDCIIECEFVYYRGGVELKKDKFTLVYDNYELLEDSNLVYSISPDYDLEDGKPGFVVFSVASKNNERIFKSRAIFGNYAICSKENEKSIFLDYSYKAGDPQTVNQMATWGRFIITYAVINVNLNRGCSNSFILINPYNKPIVVSFVTSDARILKRIKIMPQDAQYYPLKNVLKKGETSWRGHIQLTASNRVVSYIVSHRYDNVESISDAEHLDPFRSDATHRRFLQKIRQKIGSVFS